MSLDMSDINMDGVPGGDTSLLGDITSSMGNNPATTPGDIFFDPTGGIKYENGSLRLPLSAIGALTAIAGESSTSSSGGQTGVLNLLQGLTSTNTGYSLFSSPAGMSGLDAIFEDDPNARDWMKTYYGLDIGALGGSSIDPVSQAKIDASNAQRDLYKAGQEKLGEKSFFKDYAPILTIGGNLLAGAYTASMNEKIADKNIAAQKSLLDQRIQADKSATALALDNKKITVGAPAPAAHGLISQVNQSVAAQAAPPNAQAPDAKAPDAQAPFSKSAAKPTYDMTYYRNNVTGGQANA